MNKKFVFTYENPKVETLTAEFKKDKLISDPYNTVYPMTHDTHKQILDGFGLNLKESVDSRLGSTILTTYFNEGEDEDLSVTFFNNGKAVKKNTILNMLKVLRKSDCKIGIIVVAGASKGCEELVRTTSSAYECSYALIEINRLMTPAASSTIPALLGRYANKSMGDPDEAKQTIVISVPSKGFPSIGKSGKLNAGDIYEILESKVEPSNDVPKNVLEKSKGFDLILEAFYDMLDIINKGKTINANRWNSILNEPRETHKEGVINFVENMEEE